MVLVLWWMLAAVWVVAWFCAGLLVTVPVELCLLWLFLRGADLHR